MEDVPLLVAHFLEKYGETMGKTGVSCSTETLKSLMGYGWPGNVRELENCIERGLLLCDGDSLEPESLPDSLRERPASALFTGIPGDNLSIKRAEDLLEREMIRRALEKTGGNRTHAARLLEISHRSLLYKLKEYGME